jgi:3'-phosphoadenosine 5'-phosphosulfate sulfotransferase (PAPS reductase)/FAD synthetase
MDPIVIEGITTSSELRRRLAADGRPVLLAFSRGKDSIAAWLALRDAGVQVIPYHLYLIPGLEFVTESLAYFERAFDMKIINLPHPSLYRWLAHAMYQPPERIRILEAAQITVPTYQDVQAMIRAQHGLPDTTWTCDGVRAADSPTRRTSLSQHGPVSDRNRTVKAVWDWRKHHVYDTIAASGISLPREYDWFGRSFDGLDRRFLAPIREHAPADYQRILDWFPLADLEFHRAAAR